MIEKINKEIKENIKTINTDLISDGWHTFGELYNHRSLLFLKLCKELSKDEKYLVYKSKKHFDGSDMEGYFNLGVKLQDDTFVAYHISNQYWDECDFAETLEKSPIEGEYSSKDAVNNLMKI